MAEYDPAQGNADAEDRGPLSAEQIAAAALRNAHPVMRKKDRLRLGLPQGVYPKGWSPGQPWPEGYERPSWGTTVQELAAVPAYLRGFQAGSYDYGPGGNPYPKTAGVQAQTAQATGRWKLQSGLVVNTETGVGYSPTTAPPEAWQELNRTVGDWELRNGVILNNATGQSYSLNTTPPDALSALGFGPQTGGTAPPGGTQGAGPGGAAPAVTSPTTTAAPATDKGPASPTSPETPLRGWRDLFGVPTPGTVPDFSKLTDEEAKYNLPFAGSDVLHLSPQEGARYAAGNIARAFGLSPDVGNPYSDFIASEIPQMAELASYWKEAMGEPAGNKNIAQGVGNALGTGTLNFSQGIAKQLLDKIFSFTQPGAKLDAPQASLAARAKDPKQAFYDLYLGANRGSLSPFLLNNSGLLRDTYNTLYGNFLRDAQGKTDRSLFGSLIGAY